jgi:hypothetical protein
MCGGIIVQVVGNCIAVVDYHSFDRCWRKIEPAVDVKVHDEIWWQAYEGFLSRKGEVTDRRIGRCMGCNNPTTYQRQAAAGFPSGE